MTLDATLRLPVRARLPLMTLDAEKGRALVGATMNAAPCVVHDLETPLPTRPAAEAADDPR